MGGIYWKRKMSKDNKGGQRIDRKKIGRGELMGRGREGGRWRDKREKKI